MSTGTSSRRRPSQEGELDDAGRTPDVGADAAQQRDRRVHRPAGRQQVVEHDDALTLRNRIGLDLDRVGAVFERVFVADRGARQLVLLAHHGEAEPEPVGERRGDQEAARFDADQPVRFVARDRFRQRIHRRPPGARVLQQGGDVVKQDAGLREVRDLADMVLERRHAHRSVHDAGSLPGTPPAAAILAAPSPPRPRRRRRNDGNASGYRGCAP